MSNVLARCLDLAIFAGCVALCCNACRPQPIILDRTVTVTGSSLGEEEEENPSSSVPNMSLLEMNRV